MWTGTGRPIPITNLTNPHLLNIINKLENKARYYVKFKRAQLKHIGPINELDKKFKSNLTEQTVLDSWPIYKELIAEANRRKLNLGSNNAKSIIQIYS